jgi:hypothetical protein
MSHARRITLVASIIAVIAATTAAPAAPADDAGAPTIVYSDTYLKLIAKFPAGYADSCDAQWFLNGGTGTCFSIVNIQYFYPDGSFGPRSWYVDASSPTGWSIAPDPCIGLREEESSLWAWYVDWVNGYFDSGPHLTSEQINRYGACWSWWF